MSKTESIHKALEHAFWVKFPSLNEHRDYTFDELFSDLIRNMPQDGLAEYKSSFFNMVITCELPLTPVIPLPYDNGPGRVALDHNL
jgi:hypothetical protein